MDRNSIVRMLKSGITDIMADDIMAEFDMMQGDIELLQKANNRVNLKNAEQGEELITLRTLVNNVLQHNSSPAIIKRDGVIRELREEIAAYREVLRKVRDFEYDAGEYAVTLVKDVLKKFSDANK